jgi:C-terminal region of band_7
LLKARATAAGIEQVAQTLQKNTGGAHAVSLLLAEKYIDAFGNLAKSSTTLLLPGGTSGSLTSDPASFVAQVGLISSIFDPSLFIFFLGNVHFQIHFRTSSVFLKCFIIIAH